MTKLKAVWHSDINFGDALTPYIIEKMFGTRPAHAEPTDTDMTYIVTGSILDGYISNSIIWGAGVMYKSNTILPKKYPPPTENFKLIAVRGPISQQKCHEAGYDVDILGDPALVLPHLYNPDITKKYKLGLIPSWVDLNITKKFYGDDPRINIIDVFRPVENVIDEILSCDITLCSALHGLITSIAYDIPTKWVEFSDNIIGDGTKYFDFLTSMNLSYEPSNLRHKCQYDDLINIPFKHEKNIDIKKLWNSSPFKRWSI